MRQARGPANGVSDRDVPKGVDRENSEDGVRAFDRIHNAPQIGGARNTVSLVVPSFHSRRFEAAREFIAERWSSSAWLTKIAAIQYCL